MMKKICAMVLCLSMFNLGMAYAFNGDTCISCDDENMKLVESMGFTVEQTEEGMLVTNSFTGEQQLIVPQYDDGLCRVYTWCVWYTFWIAMGIFFIPCLIGQASACG